jgi:hypothetical protein
MNPTTCKHYNGTQNKVCACGVSYKEVTPGHGTTGAGLRVPCHTKPVFTSPTQLAEFEKRGKCDKLELPTKEDLAERERWIESMNTRMMKTVPVISRIKNEHRSTDWKGVVECPICKGNLHMSHAGYNGHVHGKCETKDCVNWME